MSAQLDKLRTDRAAILEAADELQKTLVEESRKRTPEEDERFNKYMDEIESLAVEIDSLGRLEDAQEKANASQRTVPPVAEIRTEQRVDVTPVYDKSQLRAFTGPNAVENAHRASKWVAGVIYDIPEAREWCREHGVEQRVQVEGVNASGGALVPTEMDTAIINIRNTYGMIRQQARVIDMGTDTMSIPRRVGGLTVYFPGETTATTPSDTSWDNVNLVAKEASVLTRVSKSLSEDSMISITDMLAEEMGQAFAKKEDEIVIDGDATSTYGGMTGFRTKMVDGAHAGSYITATSGDDQFTELLEADLISCIGKLPQYGHANAKWYISQYGWGAAFLRLVSAHGGNAMSDLAEGMVQRFMGYPVILNAAMPSATTAYNLTVMLAFGDMRQAVTMGSRKGITIEVDRSRYLEYRQLGVLGTERFDIVVHDIGDGTNAGPLVGFRGQS